MPQPPEPGLGPRAGVVGTVERFDAEVGLGIVTAVDGGGSYRFHCTEIADGSRMIEPTTTVRFDIGAAGPGHWEAKGLTKA